MATDIHANKTEQESAERTRTGQFYRPNVDILETKDELVLVADMPGVKPGGIDINFEEGVLTLRGTVEPRYKDVANFLLAEYGLGDYYREFRVSEKVDATRIHAEHADGVLKVHLPKAEAAKPRKIEVKAN